MKEHSSCGNKNNRFLIRTFRINAIILLNIVNTRLNSYLSIGIFLRKEYPLQTL